MENYAQLKAAGAITIDLSSTPQNLIINVKNFDPNTGQPLPSTTMSVSLDQVNTQIGLLQPQLANWQAMLADFPTS